MLLMSNGGGQEFRNYNNLAAPLGEEANRYIAAAGHNGNKSGTLVKNYTEALGFEYLCASNKMEFIGCLERFVCDEAKEHPILMEVFTNSDEENDALRIINHTIPAKPYESERIKQIAKNVLGKRVIRRIK